MRVFCGIITALVLTIAVTDLSCAPSPPSALDSAQSSARPLVNTSIDQLSPQDKTQIALAERLRQDALELYEKGHYALALPPAQQSLAVRERILGPNHGDVAVSLNTLGLIFHQLVKIPEARAAHERALRLREQLDGSTHASVAESLTNLARVLTSSGDFSAARRLLERALQIREARLGQNHPDVAVTLMYLAMVRGLQMNLEDALRHQARAVQIFDQATGVRTSDHATALTSFGTILGRTGDFARARPLIERALHMQEQALGPAHPDVGRTLDSLADLVAKMGDWQEALPLAERALRIREESYGHNHVEVAASLNSVGRLRWRSGDLPGSAELFQEALNIIEQSVGPAHPVVAANLLDLGEVRRQMGNLAAARNMFERAMQIQEQALGSSHPALATSLTRLGGLYAQINDLPHATALFSRATSIREQVLGPAHPDLALSLNDLARLHHMRGEVAKARPLYERARKIYLTMGQLNEALDDATLAKVAQRGISGLRDYLGLLATIASNYRDRDQRSAVDDGFLVAEQARGWIVQAAVAKAMARRQAGTSDEIRLASKVEELRQHRQALWISLNQVYSQPLGKQKTDERTTLQGQLQQVQRELDVQVKQLESAFPRYAALALPKPADVTTVRQLLRQGEALISFYVLDNRLQIWMVQRDQETQYRDVVTSRTKVIALIEQLRKSLTPSGSVGVLPPVDVESAFELYHLLLEPVRPHLAGVKDLILVPDEVLLTLPFGVLLSERKGDAYERSAELHRKGRGISLEEITSYPYASLPWLVNSYTLTVLPSASVLKLLRETPRAQDGIVEPFIGFGDPVLRGSGRERGGVMVASRGTKVDLDKLRTLNSLPGTREELLAIARVLGVAPDRHLYLDQQATEAEVKRLNNSGRLGQAKVLAFSTHGLLAGELRGLTQPALVLTVPEVSSEEDDGLLTLEEVLQLKLPNTDWVVLSACNTAGGDGSGEGLSGLARAFFFAGARALLVSYWSVDDRATQTLMAEVFRRYGQKGQVPPAEALRQGMLAMLAQAEKDRERAYFAHPFAWASFLLVGEPKP